MGERPSQLEVCEYWEKESMDPSFFFQDNILGWPGPQVFFTAFLYNRIKDPAPSPPFHSDIYEALVKESRIAIAAPRAHSKSTLCSFVYPIWCAVGGKKREIIIVSQTSKLAEKWLKQIAAELEHNDLITGIFGDFKGSPWNRDQLSLSNGVNIYAKGRGFQIRGYRPDLIVLDDIEDDESVASPTQRTNLEDWFYGGLLNTLDAGKENQLVFIGNYIGPSCMLKKIIDRALKGDIPSWKAHVFKARENGEPIWPDKWSSRALDQRKQEIGTQKFSSEFMNDPLPEGMTLIRPEWIRCWDGIPENGNRFIAVDTADTLASYGDYYVIMSGISDKEGKLYVAKYQRGRYSPKQFWDALFAEYKSFRPIAVGIEARSRQNMMRYAASKEMQERKTWFPIRWIPANEDLISRVQSVVARIEHGKILIGKTHQVLRDELIEFPYGGHDDTVNALAYLDRMAYKSDSEISKEKIPENSPLWMLNRSRIGRMEDVIFNAW